MSAADKEAIQGLSDGARLARIAEAGEIVKLAGIAPAQASKCLSDPTGLSKLIGIVEAGRGLGVNGTPTFFVNGVRVEANDWSGLEPQIKQAGG